MKQGYSSQMIYSQRAGTYSFDVDSLFASTQYVTYATLLRRDATFTGVVEDANAVDVETNPPAPDTPTSVVFSGENRPSPETLMNMAKSLGRATGFPEQQIKFNDRWVTQKSGGWEVIFVFLADPSGEQPAIPADVIKNTKSDVCAQCFEEF